MFQGHPGSDAVSKFEFGILAFPSFDSLSPHTICSVTCQHKPGANMARIYIGNLPMDVTEKDMDDVFYKFGRIVDIDLKTPARPPAFGFITFQDARDAEEAVRARYASER